MAYCRRSSYRRLGALRRYSRAIDPEPKEAPIEPHLHRRQARRVQRQLHDAGCFVLPNPWDVGSARILEHLGFKALATTSAGMAWAMGRADGQVSLDEVLIHLSQLAHATTLPLNADFENGFADAPADVATNVALAVDTGVAGLSIEDYSGRADEGLYPFDLAVARVAAAREAIDRTSSGVVLTARSEGFIRGAPDLGPRPSAGSNAFAEAGADCLYAPGLRDEAQITAAVVAGRRAPEAGEPALAGHAGRHRGRPGAFGGSASAARWPARPSITRSCAPRKEIADQRHVRRARPSRLRAVS